MRWVEWLQLALPLGLIAIGYVVGRLLELRHYRSIRAREQELQGIVALSTRWLPEGVQANGSELVSGAVVVSSDYFKTFVAGFRQLVGGRFRGYESLLERARREALLRLKAEAQARGARLVIGLRFQTTSIAGSSTPSVEVMAFGTLIR